MVMETRKQVRYRVFFTPKASFDTYGTEIEVSDKIDVRGVNSIKKSIDSGDYQLGVFVTDDIVIKGYNINGFFNDEYDSRSIFPAGRDLTKVRINFTELDDDGDEITAISFEGLINDEATRHNIKTESISFRVLSNDSVIRNTKVASGLISSGTLYSTAILNILSQTRITAVLGVSALNINPGLDLTIDLGSAFDDVETLTALNKLLVASNSVMIIDPSNNVIIKSRDEDTTRPIINLFGKSDESGRENIADINKYNSGRHRMFTSVKVNSTERSNPAFEEEFGSRRKNITLDFVTVDTKEIQIADNVLDEFKAPKVEVAVFVRTAEVRDAQLLDRVSVNYPLRVALPDGANFLPVIGVTTIDDASEPLPRQFGSISIKPRLGFKIIEMQERPSDFLTKLKLRQIGNNIGDGVLDGPDSCLVGFARIDGCILAVGGDPCQTWNPSVLGAAKMDCTKLA